MHLTIPNTVIVKCSHSANYTAYNVYTDGYFHASIRYRQFHNFHEAIRREVDMTSVAHLFPPKKLLSLSGAQIEERRAALEKYLQMVCQDPQVIHSKIFNDFLLRCQLDVNHVARQQDIYLDVYHMSGEAIDRIRVSNQLNTNQTMQYVAKAIELSPELVPFFGLYLLNGRDIPTSNSDASAVASSSLTLLRRLRDIESPHLALKVANHTHDGGCVIVLRRAYWDTATDATLLHDVGALSILYAHAVHDVEKGLLGTDRDSKRQLKSLQKAGHKADYVSLAASLKDYGLVHFESCLVEGAGLKTRASLAMGWKSIILRYSDPATRRAEELRLKISRIKCWRLNTTYMDKKTTSDWKPCDSNSSRAPIRQKLSLSLEYLMKEDNLQWITIHSEQSITMSSSLQEMIEELVSKKERSESSKTSAPSTINGHDSPDHSFNGEQVSINGHGQSSCQNRDTTTSYQEVDRNGAQRVIGPEISSDSMQENGSSKGHSTHPASQGHKRNGSRIPHSKSHPSGLQNGRTTLKSLLRNAMFDEIGDEDL